MLLGAFVVIDFFALVGWAGTRLADPGSFPIRGVHVEGEFRRLKPTEVEALVAAQVRGGFFTMQVDALQEQLRVNPWIQGVSIRRVWPDQLQVTVLEQRAVAAWGERGLVNRDGQVFRPPRRSFPAGLARLYGPPGSAARVLASLRVLEGLLARLEVRVTALRVSPRGSWEFDLENGLTVTVGRTDFQRRVTRFAKLYEQVFHGLDMGRVNRVDLRYTNGFTVNSRAALEQARQAPEGDAGEKA
ncbi:MAG: cell division protein FtsQ/DivIB [Gammaproteobacteria bacterium]